jgi:hypothetical protein
METKICSKCRADKPCNLFGKDKLRKDGLRVHCNDCRKLESKLYREKYPEKRKETIKNYYNNNKEDISNRFKSYKENNTEKVKDISNKSYHKNKDKHKNKLKEYRRINKVSRSKYNIELKEKNTIYKVSTICRTRIYNFLLKNNISKKNKTFEIISCSPQFLKEYLENKFTDGMSWDNYGFYGWHIDHIIPLSSAKTEEEVIKLCHYTNLQPLWAIDNLKKSSKIL